MGIVLLMGLINSDRVYETQ